jgi:hypothetical protein
MMGCGAMLDKPKGRKLQWNGRDFIPGDRAFIWSLRDLQVEVPEKLTKIVQSRLEDGLAYLKALRK